jgi:carbonic anhydrase/acetyltransferase-like protein (isoleucine patch superfamily)
MIIAYKKFTPKIHAQTFIAPSAAVIGRVNIERKASIWFGAVLRGDINQIKVGTRSNIQDNAVVHVESNRACIINNDVTVGHQATIHACRIEEGCLIGIGARILNGAVVGRYSIVGAGAIVLEGMRVPPFSLVVGVPARVIRRLTKKEIKANLESAKKYERVAKWHKDHLVIATHNPMMNPLNELY